MREVIFLNPEIKKFFSNQDPFQKAKEIEGTIYRDFANRVTKEFKINENSYFIKVHLGLGWREILKNYAQLKQPSFGAHDEWKALNKLQEIGIKCPEPVAFGRQGINPSQLESFIITKSLDNTVSLEDLTLEWKRKPPSKAMRDSVLRNVAELCKRMHLEGINHRDLYLCHFHVNKDNPSKETYLIDLHRAQLRKHLPNRWIVKDIGGLLHSAIDLNFSKRHFYQFFKIYFNCSIRELFLYHSKFIKSSSERAIRMFLKPKINEDLQKVLLSLKGDQELLFLLEKELNKDIKSN
tara:strand:+ start:1594 stop:2475 length:882 start_codon:yes stop_codon:yes gene_type:complete